MRSGFEPADVGMAAEQFRNGLPEGAGAHSMDDPDLCHLGENSVIEKLIGHAHSFFHLAAHQVDFVLFKLLPGNADADALREVQGRLLDGFEIIQRPPHLDGADQNLRLAVTDRHDRAGHSQGKDADRLALLQRRATA